MDDELAILLLNSDEFCRLVESPIYEQFVEHLFSSDNPLMVEKAITKLQAGGFDTQAGTLYMKSKGIHSSLYSFYNTFQIIKTKFK